MSSNCTHEFEEYDTRLIEEIRNAGIGTRRGVPKQLYVDLSCKKCGRDVPVEYNLSFIDGDRV